MTNAVARTCSSAQKNMCTYEEENAALFSQLVLVQEELERQYYQKQKPKTETCIPVQPTRAGEELVAFMAESIRVEALLCMREKILAAEKQNALASRLGNLVMESPTLSVPVRLLRMQRAILTKTPPAELGGKEFSKVLEAYQKDGMEGVSTLLATVFLSPAMQANAYTALARSLQQNDLKAAAQVAAIAYHIDPQAYRLKWLAFRLFEADECIEAEAALDALPANTSMTDSEKRMMERLRKKATATRIAQAKTRANGMPLPKAILEQISDLTQEKNILQQEKDALQDGCATLQQEKDALQDGCATLQQEKDTLQETIAAQMQENQRIETVRRTLQEENAEFGRQITQHQADLLHSARLQLDLEQEKDALQDGCATLQQEKDTLQETIAAQMQENQRIETVRRTLQEENAEFGRQITQHQADLLHSARLQLDLEQEKATLAKRVHELEDHAALYAKKLDSILAELANHAAKNGEQASLLAVKADTVLAVVQKQEVMLKEQQKLTVDEQNVSRKWFDKQINQSLIQTRLQLEASMALQQYFATGELPVSIPFGDNAWPVTPDFSLLLVQQIEQRNYDIIIEFGSGTSTVLMAQILAGKRKRYPETIMPEFVSFDHLELYYGKTLEMLRESAVVDMVNLVHAPLRDYTAPNGEIFAYYSCEPVLEALAARYGKPGGKILVVVDGPPTATGKHARYPAVPLLVKYFPQAHMDFLLDDYIRDDEKETAVLWQTYVAQAGFMSHLTEKKLKKEACLMRIIPVAREKSS